MKKPNGFTLIELLVVISIIAILSTVGFVSFQNVQKNAKDAKVRADIDAIKKAYETNYDPSGGGGQGAYKVLTNAMFASGKIPTPDNTSATSYFLVGPNVSDTNYNTNSFLVCTPVGGNRACSEPASNCVCASSIGGSGTPVYNAPPPASACSTVSVWNTDATKTNSINGCGVTTTALTALGVPVDGTGTVYITCPQSTNTALITTLQNCSTTNSNSYTSAFQTIYRFYLGDGNTVQGKMFGQGTSDYVNGSAKPVKIKLRDP